VKTMTAFMKSLISLVQEQVWNIILIFHLQAAVQARISVTITVLLTAVTTGLVTRIRQIVTTDASMIMLSAMQQVTYWFMLTVSLLFQETVSQVLSLTIHGIRL